MNRDGVHHQASFSILKVGYIIMHIFFLIIYRVKRHSQSPLIKDQFVLFFQNSCHINWKLECNVECSRQQLLCHRAENGFSLFSVLRLFGIYFYIFLYRIPICDICTLQFTQLIFFLDLKNFFKYMKS